jgi:hypothetical protein
VVLPMRRAVADGKRERMVEEYVIGGPPGERVAPGKE